MGRNDVQVDRGAMDMVPRDFSPFLRLLSSQGYRPGIIHGSTQDQPPDPAKSLIPIVTYSPPSFFYGLDVAAYSAAHALIPASVQRSLNRALRRHPHRFYPPHVLPIFTGGAVG
jgi:hypothetical protein